MSLRSMSARELYDLSLTGYDEAKMVCKYLCVGFTDKERLVPKMNCGPNELALRKAYAMLRVESKFPIYDTPKKGLLPYGYYFERIHGSIVSYSLSSCLSMLRCVKLELDSLVYRIDQAFAMMSVPNDVTWVDILLSDCNTTGLGLTVQYTCVRTPEKFLFRFAKIAHAYVKRLEDRHVRMVARTLEPIQAHDMLKDAVIDLSRTDFKEHCEKKKHSHKEYLEDVETLLIDYVNNEEGLDVDFVYE